MSVIGSAEKKILNLFQNDFLGLLQTFRRIDRNRTNSISIQEFRAAIESHFGIEISDEEFNEFAHQLPREDASNRVKYLEFMTKFDTDSSSTLFDNRSIGGSQENEFRPKPSKRHDYDAITEEDEEAPFEMQQPRMMSFNQHQQHQLKSNNKKSFCREKEEVCLFLKVNFQIFESTLSIQFYLYCM